MYVYFEELGLTGQQIGWLATLAPVMMLVSFPVAWFADKNRLKVRFLQISVIGLCVIVFLLGYAKEFKAIFLLVLLMAVINSPIMPLAESMIARAAQRDHLNYGSMRLWGSYGYALSALIFGLMWDEYGFGPMFTVASIILIPVIWISGKLEEGPRGETQENGSILKIFSKPGLAFLIVATFFSGIANSIGMTFAGMYAHSLGGDNSLIGVMIATGAMVEFPIMYYSEQIARKLTSANTLLISYGLMAMSYVCFIFFPSPGLLPLFSVFKGLGFALWITNTIRLFTEHAPPQWSATGQSALTFSMMGLAPLVAGPVGGWFYDSVHPSAVFWFAILALLLASAVVWLASFKKYLE